jgi:hypothetical protein
VGATWDGTWLRADLCEGNRGENYENEPLVQQKHIKKKVYKNY